MRLYNKECAEVVRNAGWPAGIEVDVIEYPDHLALVFYRDNFEEISESKRQIAAEIVPHVINKIRKLGCPIVLEVRESAS